MEIERDSSLVVNVVRVRSIFNWRLKALLDFLLAMLNQFEAFTVNHIYREGNKEVDTLDNRVIDGLKEVFIMGGKYLRAFNERMANG